jgi:hypothetical protein
MISQFANNTYSPPEKVSPDTIQGIFDSLQALEARLDVVENILLRKPAKGPPLTDDEIRQAAKDLKRLNRRK